MGDTTRPAPVRTPDNAFFWEAARAGRLVAQRCASCARLRHPPRPMCPSCGSLDVEIVDLSGRGTVYSCVALHYPVNDRYEYPVVGALVDLEEGIRLVSNVVGASVADVRLGDAVEVTFLPVDDGWAVPVFRRVDDGGDVP